MAILGLGLSPVTGQDSDNVHVLGTGAKDVTAGTPEEGTAVVTTAWGSSKAQRSSEITSCPTACHAKLVLDPMPVPRLCSQTLLSCIEAGTWVPRASPCPRRAFTGLLSPAQAWKPIRAAI